MAASSNTNDLGNAFDGLLKTPSASASTSAEYPPYDVFINHYGDDVKHTLATTIYNKLDATGLRVFLDKYELKLGDLIPNALQEAMATASLHIAIFSENYAKSPWCLAELAFMLQTGMKFIPVFYYVEPFTLRWAIEGKGIYADAFSSHENKGRYSPELLQRWKRALHDASLIKGQIINNQGEEQEAVKNVVNRVLQQLKKDRLDVAKHPVGLDEAVQDFYNTALQSAGPIQIVGIWGMGGAGKTTLAMELYNKKCSTFDRSSFLFDVREASRKGLLHEKQKQLLEDLGFKGKDAPFDNVHQGKQILKSRLRSVTVLIVLDDVDHTDQLDALLPARESLGHGSLIIVTTRELRVLKAWGVSAINKIRTLNDHHAQQLFCWHAFGQPSPLLEFEDIAKKIINACDGLPLSLKVLGGQLYGESSKNYWQSELDKFSRIMPDDIKSRLKISYDALDKEEKEMFLDVACFFIGWRSSTVIAVWDALEWNGLHGWQKLVNKCLVELQGSDYVEDNYIRMHDHLRDLGREIANQQSPYRLWSKSQIIEIHPQQAIGIRGMVNAIGNNCYQQQGKIIIRTSQGELSLEPRSLGLKIFVGNGDFINHEHSELSRELVWLRCNQFQHKSLPSWLSLKDLRILELSSPQKLEDLWECDEDAPLQLRELIIQKYISLQGFPRSIAHLRNLKKIIIEENYMGYGYCKLSSLPQEFCHLQSLEHLKMKWCEKLSSLPSNFGKLTNLQHIDLSFCSGLEMLPDSFEKLILLEYLNLQHCEKPTIKARVFENMTKLGYLNLEGCRKLEELRLPEVASLTELYLGGTSLKEVPANIFQQTKLTELTIGSGELTTLPTSLGNLSSLTTLAIWPSEKLESLPDSLEHLNFLRDLTIMESGVKCLPKSFIHLQSLRIDCTPISELSFGSGCMLKTIKLESTKVSRISIRGDCCPFLETLRLSSNKNLRELETLPETLKSLRVYNCEELGGLPCLAELTSLEEFELRECHKVEKVEGLGSVTSLQTLGIDDCSELDGLPSLATLTSLKKFKLRKYHKVEKVEGLESLTSLQTLGIDDCSELDGLPSLATLTSLKEFKLRKYHKVEKVEGLESLTSLQALGIDDCSELDGLPSLAGLTSLEEFELRNCHKVEKVEGLESLTSLHTLCIDDCSELDGLPNLATLTSLKKFKLKKCHKVEKVEGLESLTSLQSLCIDDCSELDGLPSLATLTSLKEFKLKKCHKVEKVEGLERLTSLEKLEVLGCSKAPCIVRLEDCERLKSLVIVANDRTVVEPFKQKWPEEVIICTRALIDVGSLKSVLTSFPLKSKGEYGYGSLYLRRPESSPNANAILICFIIDCVNTNADVYILEDGGKCFQTELANGKWQWMGVFQQGSDWLQSNRYKIRTDYNAKVREAWVVMGEEGSILEAFHQLSQRMVDCKRPKSSRFFRPRISQGTRHSHHVGSETQNQSDHRCGCFGLTKWR